MDVIGRKRIRKQPLPSKAVTVYYNNGIYLKAEGRLSDAQYVYEEILKDYAQDIHCNFQ